VKDPPIDYRTIRRLIRRRRPQGNAARGEARWTRVLCVHGSKCERTLVADPRVVDFSLAMERPICEFGSPGPLRDRLVDAVLSGVKTATSSLLADWDRDGQQPPAAGELQTVIDSAGIPVAIIEILASEMVALGEVDDHVARAEGESYQTAAGWRCEHERFWREEVFPNWKGDIPVLDDSTPVVVEWFRVRERV
jgi:uncharacterized protein YhfF